MKQVQFYIITDDYGVIYLSAKDRHIVEYNFEYYQMKVPYVLRIAKLIEDQNNE